MPYVAALYRYPVKGLTPEPREALTIKPDGRVEGDRVLGFRFANVAGDDWGTKHNMLVLMNTPGLARLNLSFDSKGNRLALSVNRVKLVDAVLDDEGRALICAAVADYVQRTRENPLAGNPERLPLRLIGDGQTAKYQDSKDGYVTMHGRGSLIALGAALNELAIDEERFRSNIVLDDLDAWEEMTWAGRRIRIGQVEFDVLEPAERCIATHANPETGERDMDVLSMLTKMQTPQSADQNAPKPEPSFAVLMTPRGMGEVRLGDEVAVL